MREMNPYEPPRAALSDPLLSDENAAYQKRPSVLRGSARRPISIWLLLVVAWCLGAFFGAGIFKHLFEAVAGGASWSPLKSLINAGILLLVSSYLITLALAIHRRRSWLARTLGTSFLALVVLIAALGSGSPSAGCGTSPDCVQSWWVGRFAIAAVLMAWAFTAGWSPGAKRYYLVG